MGKKEAGETAGQSLVKALRVVGGIAVALGALAAWHYWHVDGLVAFIIGAAGLAAAGIR